MSERPSTEQLLVQVLLRCCEDVLHVLAAAPVDAEARQRTGIVLALSFAPIWERLQLLTLRVAKDAVTWEGHTVLDRDDGSGGLVRALHTAGIRSLTLVPGVERGEIQAFLAAVDRAGRGSGRAGSEDLVTLLFRADLRHLVYEVEPTSRPSASTLAPARPTVTAGSDAALERRRALRSDATAKDRRGTVRAEDFDSTLYFLDQKEIEYLKASIDQEYDREPAHDVVTLLFDTLEARSEPAVRAEVLDVLSGLLPQLLGTGRFDEVAYLSAEARRVSQSADLGEHKDALERLRFGVSEPATLAQLFHALEDGGVRPTADVLWTLMREMSPDAVRRVLVWPERMSNLEAGSIVTQAVDAFFRHWPLALGRMLGAEDRTVVHAALGVAARAKHPEFADLVAQAAEDPDPTTRARVATALAAIGTPRSLKLLAQMASDVDGDVRTLVFAAFTSRPYRGALTTLESALSSPDLENRSEREKRAIFDAFASSAGPDGIDTLESFLRGRGPEGHRCKPHTRACAAHALGRIGTTRARAALENVARDRDPLVRNAVSSALRGLP